MQKFGMFTGCLTMLIYSYEWSNAYFQRYNKGKLDAKNPKTRKPENAKDPKIRKNMKIDVALRGGEGRCA